MIYSGYTDRNGIFSLSDLAYGTYIVRELESLSNYQTNKQSWTVELNDKTPIIELEITNEKIEYPNTATNENLDIERALLQSILVFVLCVVVLKRYL